MMTPSRYKTDSLSHIAPCGAERRARMEAAHPGFATNFRLARPMHRLPNPLWTIKSRPITFQTLLDNYRNKPAILKNLIHRYSSMLTQVDFGGVAATPVPANGKAYLHDDNGRPILLSPGINLDGATLREFNVSRAKLIGSSFRNTTFRNASLDRIAGLLTDFTGANLALSFMWNAHFAYARFDEAHLSLADLREAIFFKCSLKQTMLEGALIDGASFTDCELDADAFRYTIGTPRVTEHGRQLTDEEVTTRYRQDL